MMQEAGRHRLLAVLLTAATWGWAGSAEAQTWTGGRTTPVIGELVAVDATGEQLWLYGQEDLAGDGLTFMQQEQNIDIRTAYASTDPQQLFARVYISDTNGPGGNIEVYFFIDSDNSDTSGGTAAATEVHAAFTSDDSPGGYEFVVGVAGNESIIDVWEWDEPSSMYVTVNTTPMQTAAEAGTDLDPIGIGASDHGYLQAMIDLDVVGLTQACNANIFVRSVNDIPSLGTGDLDVGEASECVPPDADGDDVPDIVEPPTGCQSDDECPLDGVCVEGECLFATPCTSDGDCAGDEQCIDGQCIVVGGDDCTVDDDCGDLVCIDGQCSACSVGSGECGDGQTCGPDGRCVEGDPGGSGSDIVLPPGTSAQGGACTCSLPRHGRYSPLALLTVAALTLLRRRNRQH